MNRIAVVDYGMGNLRSVAKAVQHAAGDQAEVVVTDDPGVVASAERVVVPGQGAARACMQHLREHGLEQAVVEAAASKPFLGICMGLQVLMQRSDENDGVDCLGLYPGRVRYFGVGHRDRDGELLKIPHMGWNRVRQRQRHPLWRGIEDSAWFYFVHSYFVDPDDPALIAGSAEHGIEFTCAIARDNVFACQFHPEKSAADGLRLLANFAVWDGVGAC